MSEVVDDESISDSDGLLRRVPFWPSMYKFDHNIQRYRLTTACFSDKETKDEELSITLEAPLLSGKMTHKDIVRNHSGFGVAKFTAALARHEVSVSQKIVKDPTPDDEFHGLVVGKKPKSVKKAFVKGSLIVVEPSKPD
jgi:hypothetical protein